MEDIRGRILRLFAVSNATGDVSVDSVKIVFVELGEACWILPRRLYLQLFVILILVLIFQVLVFQRLQDVLRGVLNHIIPKIDGKVTAQVNYFVEGIPAGLNPA